MASVRCRSDPDVHTKLSSVKEKFTILISSLCEKCWNKADAAFPALSTAFESRCTLHIMLLAPQRFFCYKNWEASRKACTVVAGFILLNYSLHSASPIQVASQSLRCCTQGAISITRRTNIEAVISSHRHQASQKTGISSRHNSQCVPADEWPTDCSNGTPKDCRQTQAFCFPKKIHWCHSGVDTWLPLLLSDTLLYTSAYLFWGAIHSTVSLILCKLHMLVPGPLSTEGPQGRAVLIYNAYICYSTKLLY